MPFRRAAPMSWKNGRVLAPRKLPNGLASSAAQSAARISASAKTYEALCTRSLGARREVELFLCSR
jgi:hypothetical protein